MGTKGRHFAKLVAVGDIRNRITEIRKMRLGDIAHNPRNWRGHPDNQRASFRGVVSEIGWAGMPLIYHSERVGGLTYVDGHMRKEELPDLEADVAILDLTDEEADLLLATYDPVSAAATADREKLGALLQNVKSGNEGVQALLSGLAEREGVFFGNGNELPEDPGAQISRADELQEVWQVSTGDLWVIPSNTADGEHRVICGDCTDVVVVERVMGGERCNLLFTSPPYWIGKEYEIQDSEDEIYRFIRDCVRCWTDFVNVDFGRIVINTGTARIHKIEKKRRVEILPLIDRWQEELRHRGWLARHFRIWAKSGDFPARISPRVDVVDQHWEHIVTFEHEDFEYVGTFWSPAGHQRGQEKIGTPWAQQGVWSDIKGDRSAGNTHIAAFPLDLPERNIMLYSKESEIAIDPFLGSGTTLVACERLARLGRGIEIHAPYVAVCLERLSQMDLEPRRVT